MAYNGSRLFIFPLNLFQKLPSDTQKVDFITNNEEKKFLDHYDEWSNH